MTVHLFDEDFHYLMINPIITNSETHRKIMEKYLPKKAYWVCNHDEYLSQYVVFAGDPRDYDSFMDFNNVQLGFYDKRLFIDMGEYRDKQIDEILK